MLERVGTYLSHQNFCDGVDLAVGQQAAASSVFQSHSPEEAVDGLPNEESCFWSAPGIGHWWSLDLGDELTIVKIRITNMVCTESTLIKEPASVWTPSFIMPSFDLDTY